MIGFCLRVSGLSGAWRRAAGLVLVLVGVLAFGAAAAGAQQNAHRTRRESNANRKARIERTVEDTYTHRWEVAAGGGYLRFRSGEYTKQNNEITGWASAQYSLTPRLGAVVMGNAAFGSAKLGNNPEDAVNPQIQNYTFVGGPEYRFVATQRFAVSGYVAGGVAYGRFSTGPKDFPPTVVGLWPSGLDGAFTVGANLDYNFYPNLSARITPNYMGTTFGGTIQNDKGLNLGLVYRFGRIH